MKSFCINLDRRPERWAVTKQHLEEQGLKDVIRFSGIDNSWMGCRDSFLSIFEKYRKEDGLMIFEDDVLFINNKGFMIEAIEQMPENASVLYFGCSPRQPQEKYSKNLFRIKNAVCLHAFLITNEHGCIDYILEHRAEIQKIDDFFATVVQEKFNCFCVYPMVATQRETGTSDTCLRSDVLSIADNYAKFCQL